jgi:peptidoglycan/xylan/chitin deacetylase (PgdA/CDA1 family)
MMPGATAAERVSTRVSWSRLHAYYKRNAARLVFRRPLAIRSQVPLISFTFDDFPRSALVTGGAILSRYGLSGTYYVSLGLLGKDSPSGPICDRDDVRELHERGHELGCHTFSHCHSWDTNRSAFEESLIQNRTALSELLPGAAFRSFSYPISEPRPLTKRGVAEYFLSCRAGGQRLNTGTVDLNLLAAYFLEKSRDRIQTVQNVIDENRAVRGWLIFATHDVSENPSPFGCTPEFFEAVVQYAASSGARILPVIHALDVLQPRAGVTCREYQQHPALHAARSGNPEHTEVPER